MLDQDGCVVSAPMARPPPYRPPKLSECAPLFMSAYKSRRAGAVIHSHSLSAVMATMLYDADEFRITEVEMIKGIKGHGFYDVCVVPIIENTAYESELTSSLQDAIDRYPKTSAVLVRSHGVYVWGDNWIQAKTQAECYHYLFEAAVQMKRMGIDPRTSRTSKKKKVMEASDLPHQNGKVCVQNGGDAHQNGSSVLGKRTAKESQLQNGATSKRPSGINVEEKDRQDLVCRNKIVNFDEVILERKPKAIILDIEGTTTPLSFVQEILFPYARQHLERFFNETWDSKFTFHTVTKLFDQIIEDEKNMLEYALTIKKEFKSFDASWDWGTGRCKKECAIKICVRACNQFMDDDRKIPVLKDLQGEIWKDGYHKNELQGEVYEDVPRAFKKWFNMGIKLHIYSSGSVQAQKLLFENTAWGNLLPYLTHHFDTKVGAKRNVESYRKILDVVCCGS